MRAINPSDIKWYHSIDLPSRPTAGFKVLGTLFAEADTIFSYPVARKTFLDVGAWDPRERSTR